MHEVSGAGRLRLAWQVYVAAATRAAESEDGLPKEDVGASGARVDPR